VDEDGNGGKTLLEGDDDVRRQIAADDGSTGKMDFSCWTLPSGVPAVDDIKDTCGFVTDFFSFRRQEYSPVGAFEQMGATLKRTLFLPA